MIVICLVLIVILVAVLLKIRANLKQKKLEEQFKFEEEEQRSESAENFFASLRMNPSLLESDYSVSTDIEGAYSSSGTTITFKKRSNRVFYFLVLSAMRYDHTLDSSRIRGDPVHKRQKAIRDANYNEEDARLQVAH